MLTYVYLRIQIECSHYYLAMLIMVFSSMIQSKYNRSSKTTYLGILWQIPIWESSLPTVYAGDRSNFIYQQG